jgi:hypothetical protein
MAHDDAREVDMIDKLVQEIARLTCADPSYVATRLEDMKPLLTEKMNTFQIAAIVLLAVATGGSAMFVRRMGHSEPTNRAAWAGPIRKTGLKDYGAKEINLASALVNYMEGYAANSECDVTGVRVSRARPLACIDSSWRGVSSAVTYAKRKDEPEFVMGIEGWASINGNVIRGLSDFIASQKPVPVHEPPADGGRL